MRNPSPRPELLPAVPWPASAWSLPLPKPNSSSLGWQGGHEADVDEDRQTWGNSYGVRRASTVMLHPQQLSECPCLAPRRKIYCMESSSAGLV